MPMEMPDPTYGQATPPDAPCRYCGTQFAADRDFCPRCGYQRGGVSESTPAEVAAPAPSYPAYPSPSYPAYPGAPAYPALAPARGRRTTILIALAAVTFVLIASGIVYAINHNSKHGSSAAKVSVSAGSGSVFTSSSGHFAARFPETPDEHTTPGSIGTLTFTVHSFSEDDDRLYVECDDYSQPLPQSRMNAALAAGITSLAASASMTVVSDSVTTFQGHDAHQGKLTDSSGISYTALIVAYSSQRLYLLLGRDGNAYDTLVSTFVAIP